MAGLTLYGPKKNIEEWHAILEKIQNEFDKYCESHKEEMHDLGQDKQETRWIISESSVRSFENCRG